MSSAKKSSGRAKTCESEIEGALISFRSGRRTLDGFLVAGRKPRGALVVFQHGMHSNFYRGPLKKLLMTESRAQGFDCLSVNNSGSDIGTTFERFEWCLQDLDAVMSFARKRGYGSVALIGHSTGCQKVAYYQAVRRNPQVKAVVLLAPVDDYAICRRDAGRNYRRLIRRAASMARQGNGRRLLSADDLRFSAARFLSFADPSRVESKLFNYRGGLWHFRRLRCPVLAVMGEDEEYACMPVDEMGRILADRTRSSSFRYAVMGGADHGFHGREKATVSLVCRWLRAVVLRHE